MFKIIEDKDNYKVVDKITEKLWGNFSKSGFKKKRVKELMKRFSWKSVEMRKERDKKTDKRIESRRNNG